MRARGDSTSDSVLLVKLGPTKSVSASQVWVLADRIDGRSVDGTRSTARRQRI
jgi:hypothetical protein